MRRGGALPGAPRRQRPAAVRDTPWGPSSRHAGRRGLRRWGSTSQACVATTVTSRGRASTWPSAAITWQGALDAALAANPLKRGWLRRRPEGRAVSVSGAGQTRLKRELGITLPW